MATIYRENGEKIQAEPANGLKFSGEEVSGLLHSDSLEVIFLKDDMIMIIDKDAKLKRDVNPWATRIFHTSLRMNIYECIRGDALVCKSSEF